MWYHSHRQLFFCCCICSGNISAICVLIKHGDLLVANLGDSRAVGSVMGLAKQLTQVINYTLPGSKSHQHSSGGSKCDFNLGRCAIIMGQILFNFPNDFSTDLRVEAFKYSIGTVCHDAHPVRKCSAGCQSSRPHPLHAQDHNTGNPRERERVTAMGGVIKENRVGGVLIPTRWGIEFMDWAGHAQACVPSKSLFGASRQYVLLWSGIYIYTYPIYIYLYTHTHTHTHTHTQSLDWQDPFVWKV